ncbi:MAG: hypothetical protein HY907_00980 [Deltaproteobacteria bacterium]|nr:hypothetical protein [Deltaproteobacteria bacterium]
MKTTGSNGPPAKEARRDPGEPAGKAPAPSAPAAGKPAAKSRHGLYFFLLFWLPLIALFIFAILKGRES